MSLKLARVHSEIWVSFNYLASLCLRTKNKQRKHQSKAKLKLRPCIIQSPYIHTPPQALCWELEGISTGTEVNSLNVRQCWINLKGCFQIAHLASVQRPPACGNLWEGTLVSECRGELHLLFIATRPYRSPKGTIWRELSSGACELS